MYPPATPEDIDHAWLVICRHDLANAVGMAGSALMKLERLFPPERRDPCEPSASARGGTLRWQRRILLIDAESAVGEAV
jgi:hypothetical protein